MDGGNLCITFPRTKFYFWGFLKPGVREYGSEIEKNGIKYLEEPTSYTFQWVYMSNQSITLFERMR